MRRVTVALIAVAVLLCAAISVWYFSPYQRCLRLYGTDEYTKLYCGHLRHY